MGCVSSTKRPTNSLILHFTGINTNKPPKKCKSKFELFESSSIISIQTSLNINDTILKLKKFIKKIYSISPKHDLLILYSHHIISNDDRLTLSDFGITNRSLLLIAIKAPNTPKRIPTFISNTSILDSEDDFKIFEDDDDEEEDYPFNFRNTNVTINFRPQDTNVNLNIVRPQPTLLTLSTFEDDSNTFENDSNSDIFTSPRLPDSLESTSNNAVLHQRHRNNNYNSLPNIFEGSNENDIDTDLETSYTTCTSCTPTFEPEERAEEKAAMLHYNISHETTEMKRSVLYASNDTIISTTFDSLDSEYTETFDHDKDQNILKDSFESVMQMDSPKVPFQRKTQLIYPTFQPDVKHAITRLSMPRPVNIGNNSMSSLSTLSMTYSSQNNASINVEPVHTRNGAYSTTNTNTSVPITRHYRNGSRPTFAHLQNMFTHNSVSVSNNRDMDEHKRSEIRMNSRPTFSDVRNMFNQMSVNTDVNTDEHKTSEIMLSPTVSATWSTSIDIESKKQFTLDDMNNECDIEDINEYKASLKPVKGFDIIMQEADVDVYKMPNCKHVMNKDSLYHYALNKFSDKNNIYLTCPHTQTHTHTHIHESEEIKCNLNEWSCMHCTFINNITNNLCEICGNAKTDIKKKQFCNAKWNYSLIKQILYCDNIDFEDDSNNMKLIKLELLSARNKIQKYCDIQKCPTCESLYFKNKCNNDFKTKCICCNGNDNYFCWGCGQLWGKNTHACDTSFRTELIKILKTTIRKKIGDVNNVPGMRGCPNCGQIITHTEACKHMKCKSCKKDFCFVCLKMKKNGNWQCGSSSSPCPIAPIQNEKTLPNAVLINKKAFTLF